MSVSRLCQSVSDRLQSYQVSVLSDAVVCLVQNSIDAGASSVELRISKALDIECVDDGCGMIGGELEKFGTTTTAPLRRSDGDNSNIQHRRRGELLCNIVALSQEYV